MSQSIEDGKESLVAAVAETKKTMAPNSERVLALRELVNDAGITDPVKKQMIINGTPDMPLVPSERLGFLLGESNIDNATFHKLSLFGIRLLKDIPTTCTKTALSKVPGVDDFALEVIEASLKRFNLNFLSEELGCYGILDNYFMFKEAGASVEHFYACTYSHIRDLRQLGDMTEDQFADVIKHYYTVGFGIEDRSPQAMEQSFNAMTELMAELNISFRQTAEA